MHFNIKASRFKEVRGHTKILWLPGHITVGRIFLKVIALFHRNYFKVKR